VGHIGNVVGTPKSPIELPFLPSLPKGELAKYWNRI